MNLINFLKHFGGIVSEINRILKMKFLPGQHNKYVLGELLATVLKFNNNNKITERDLLLARLSLFVKNLREIEESRPELIPIFRKEIKRAKNTDVFFGVRFEINIAASLVRKGVEFEKRESPDFGIEYSKGKIQVECTSARIRSNKGSTDIYYKIASCIREKEKKDYSNNNTALFIDVTNLFYEILLNGGEPDTKRMRKEIDKTMSKKSFGSVVLFAHLQNNNTNKYESNYIRNDHSKIKNTLYDFLEKYFPFGDHKVDDLNVFREG